MDRHTRRHRGDPRVPHGVQQAFSRRRAEIEAALAPRGTDGPRAAEAAALATRRVKDPSVDGDRLEEEWIVRAAELGLQRSDLNAITGRATARHLAPAELERLAIQLASLQHT